MLITDVVQLQSYLSEKTKYFSYTEFICPCCKNVKIDSKIIDIVIQLRDYLQRPIIISSAYRCPKHNREVGGKPNSAHLKGKALDIVVEDSHTRYKVIQFLINNNISRFGIAKKFIHFDIDETLPQNVCWLY